MRPLYIICALAAVSGVSAGAVAAQPAGTPDAHGFTVFLRGTAIGREDVTVRTENGAVVLEGSGRLSPPLDQITRRAEVRYRPDWTPETLVLDAVVRGADVLVEVVFADGEARVDATEAGKPVQKVDKVSPRTVVLPNLFFGSYEALARRLADAAPGAQLPVYIAPHSESTVAVKAVATERIQTGATAFGIRRYELGFAGREGELTMHLSADEQGHLVRLTIPAQALDVVRDDVAASTSRTQTYANPGDEPVTIPASGFNIAATVTRPAAQAARYPAVVLLADGNVADRDGVVDGVPVIGQLAGAFAQAGYLAVRYDKRGYGQTGGRAESATIADLAEDARAVVRYLDRQKDVDRRRILVVGHGEGGWVAMLAASREDRIAGVVSIAAAATTGADLVLEQQRQVLERLKTSEADRQAKIELQRKIHAAVLTGKGWEDVPPDVRKQADTPWFHSLLAFDPAKVLKDLEQPILILHGDADRQVAPSHADRLAELAKKGDSRAVEVIAVRGVDHLLVPAPVEGGAAPSLAARAVSRTAIEAIVGWLARTFPANRSAR